MARRLPRPTPRLTAPHLLAHNIVALLRVRGQTKKELADWCGHTQTWIGQFLKNRRGMQLKDLDLGAAFFGLAPHHLFYPDVARMVERWMGADELEPPGPGPRSRRLSLVRRRNGGSRT